MPAPDPLHADEGHATRVYMQLSFRVTIAITMGDPFGVGPEIVVKALADPHARRRERASLAIVGVAGPLEAAATRAGLDHTRLWRRGTWAELRSFSAEGVGTPGPLAQDEPCGALLIEPPNLARRFQDVHEYPRQATLLGGESSFVCVEHAIDAALQPESPIRAIVTAPISKEAWHLAGHIYPGHTELFAQRFQAREFGMFFHAPARARGPDDGGVVFRTTHGPLNVMLASIHVPLSRVPRELTIGTVLSAIRLGTDAVRRLGVASPRVAVCGVNPHAGENGILGDDEQRVVNPAIEAARELGIDATGPHPGDTVFIAHAQGKFDLVVAMYHDQGLIPVKLLAWDHAVNCTLGLAIPRTSPDHGTAFDIAGKNRADAGSMGAAIDLAIRLAE
ncbi:MAG: 4-hydroxythreonine-4-phosphate dehydrogenase PdxA [Planctomycetota bacterium]|nr:4-hydroxythreonine-4-phosphate dehydrogenase PdxA [Planctomycetota bacterium]